MSRNATFLNVSFG
ncbi:hypothetical protein AZE42_14191 [Rhizopogon vesiculosus]|uniref:Uncharacterized protein n=1 Tax=Rhizopogon vesiculosus TaxID=180088 RepID=A0A1J8Q947_9AGAM|nr:hypothetical protein AZE42_14191 [Rhizopogon vesiculosus]